MATPLPRRIVRAAASLALLLGGGLAAVGCSGSNDVTKEKFLEDFSEQSTADDSVDECIVDELFLRLDQEEINDFYGDDPNEPLSETSAVAVEEASTKCATEPGADLGADTGTSEDGTDTTG